MFIHSTVFCHQTKMQNPRRINKAPQHPIQPPFLLKACLLLSWGSVSLTWGKRPLSPDYKDQWEGMCHTFPHRWGGYTLRSMERKTQLLALVTGPKTPVEHLPLHLAYPDCWPSAGTTEPAPCLCLWTSQYLLLQKLIPFVSPGLTRKACFSGQWSPFQNK